MTAPYNPLPPLPEIASVFSFADMRVALTNYGFACRKAALEQACAIVENTREYTRYDAVQAIKELK